MSGISRSSVSSLPKTGTIVTTTIGQGETQTITGAKEGETWKIIGVTLDNQFGSAGTMLISLVDGQGNEVELSEDLTVGASSKVPVELGKYSSGEIIVDYNIKLQATFVSGDADAINAVVGYVKVN